MGEVGLMGNADPGVYPYLDIYPAPCFSDISEVSAIAPLTNTRPESQYPFFNLCMAVLPLLAVVCKADNVLDRSNHKFPF